MFNKSKQKETLSEKNINRNWVGKRRQKNQLIYMIECEQTIWKTLRKHWFFFASLALNSLHVCAAYTFAWRMADIHSMYTVHCTVSRIANERANETGVIKFLTSEELNHHQEQPVVKPKPKPKPKKSDAKLE